MLAGKRWWSERTLDTARPGRPAHQLERAPHVLVAIDTDFHDESLADALRIAVRRLITHDPHWRVTCVGVLEPSIVTEQEESGEIQRSMHTAQLVALHHWARPLALPQERTRFHILTGSDAASSIIEYARLPSCGSYRHGRARQFVAAAFSRQRVVACRRRGALQRYRRAGLPLLRQIRIDMAVAPRKNLPPHIPHQPNGVQP